MNSTLTIFRTFTAFILLLALSACGGGGSNNAIEENPNLDADETIDADSDGTDNNADTGDKSDGVLDVDEITPVKVLFIGNSYTSVNDLPNLFAELASTKGYKIETSRVTPGGYRFESHAANSVTLDAIAAEQWDFVILQNQSQVPGWKPLAVETHSLPHAQTLVNAIRANKADTEIIYYVTWGRENGDTQNCGYYSLVCTFSGHTQALLDGYSIYQDATGGALALVGSAWETVVDDIDAPFSSADLWSADGSHPSITGSYLAANVLFVAAFNESPLGASYISTLSAGHATYLQQIATDTMADQSDVTENIDTDNDGQTNNTDTDDDGDGLPDNYESQFDFLNPLDGSDAALDQDGDGASNLMEYHYLSDAANAASHPDDSSVFKIIADDGTDMDYFASSISISGDTALIGAWGDDDKGLFLSGSAYIFARDDSGSWIQQAKLTADDAAEAAGFGMQVSLSGDTALISGGNSRGAVYVFQNDGVGNWTQRAKLMAADGVASDKFGSSLSLSGDVALIGAEGDDDAGEASGSAYLFQRDDADNWTQIAKVNASDGAAGDAFGDAVSLSGDIALIGASRDDDNGSAAGSAYIFQNDGAGNWMQQAKLLPSDGLANAMYGRSVSADTSQVAVGAFRDDDNGSGSGAVYIYQNDGFGHWTQQAKLIADDGESNDQFGVSVSLLGDMILIGAYGDDDKGSFAGAAYIFKSDGAGNWLQDDKLVAADGTADEAFGASVSLSSGFAFIGTDLEDGNNFGSAYFFSLADNP